MRILNLVVVLATLLAVAGGYLQERRRLERIRQLPVAEARTVADAQHRGRERVMLVVTSLLVAGAVAAVITRLAS